MSDAGEDKILRAIQDLDDKHTAYHEELKTVLIGDYEKPGMITRVTSLEKAEVTRKKMTFTAVGAAIASAIGAIIKHH